MKCPKCGNNISRIPDYNPSTKQVEGFRLTHIYSIDEMLRGKLCYYTKKVK
jgi:hypothetical protein